MCLCVFLICLFGVYFLFVVSLSLSVSLPVCLSVLSTSVCAHGQVLRVCFVAGSGCVFACMFACVMSFSV